MTLTEIKREVDNGGKIHWVNDNYTVIKNGADGYLIHCTRNDTYVGLAYRSTGELIENKKDFYRA